MRKVETLRLRGKAQKVLVDALLHPPAPNKTLRKAAKRYRLLLKLGIISSKSDRGALAG